MKWQDITFKDKFGFIISIASFIVGTTMSFIGMLLPPKGMIDNSVLMCTGEFLSLCAVYSGLTTYTSIFTKTIDSKINKHQQND
jgi:hypothetical protein